MFSKLNLFGKDVVKIIENDPVIKTVIINADQPMESSADNHLNKDASSKDMFEFYDKLDQDETAISQKAKVFLFEIQKDQIETLQKRLI